MERKNIVYICTGVTLAIVLSACISTKESGGNSEGSSLPPEASSSYDQQIHLDTPEEDMASQDSEERGNLSRIYPYGDSNNAPYPLEEYQISLELISESTVPTYVFQTEEPAIISLYANELYWNESGQLVPGQDASVFKLTVQLDDREYILSWFYLQFGVMDYKIYDTESGPMVLVIYDTGYSLNMNPLYYENGYFYSEASYDFIGQKIGEGGVHYISEPIS